MQSFLRWDFIKHFGGQVGWGAFFFLGFGVWGGPCYYSYMWMCHVFCVEYLFLNFVGDQLKDIGWSDFKTFVLEVWFLGIYYYYYFIFMGWVFLFFNYIIVQENQLKSNQIKKIQYLYSLIFLLLFLFGFVFNSWVLE